MKQFVRYKLEAIQDVSDRERLVQDITERADGIFLWVNLVVKRFCEALEDGRGIATFQAELAALPTELEALFEYLLLSIPKTQLKKAYQIFAMVLQDEQYETKLSLLSCLYMDAYAADA